ncbi:MAG TPA: hypothetical protein VFA04_18465 [Bryobacteraceae bacterium]|nr:hypothetical protein [Bryobacteraceae bacterium]
MSNAFISPPEETNGSAFVPDDRWELVERLSSSSTFQKAYRLRRFFLHVAQCALANKPEDATEQQIGIHVFGRTPGYNPNEDNIVRSHARLLRLKLEHYFANEGKADPYIISIPKGQYLPVFEARESSTVSPRQAVSDAAAPNRRVLIHALAALTLIFACTTFLTGGLWLRARAEEHPDQPASFNAFWNSFLAAGSSTLIVASDHTYGLLQEAARRDIPLSRYLASSYSQDAGRIARNSGLPGLAAEFNYLRLNGFDDVSDTLRLGRVDQLRRADVGVRFARDCNLRDMASGNLIVIGSHHTNPWAELFERDLNFTYKFDYGLMKNYCLNRSPRKGEAATYPPAGFSGEQDAYGTVAVVRASSGRRVLLIGGTSMAGAEMAAEFITNPSACARFLDGLPRTPGGGPEPFEVLLRGMCVAGQQAGAPVVVAWRSAPARSTWP